MINGDIPLSNRTPVSRAQINTGKRGMSPLIRDSIARNDSLGVSINYLPHRDLYRCGPDVQQRSLDFRGSRDIFSIPVADWCDPATDCGSDGGVIRQRDCSGALDFG
jgi:hypothetical protein